MQHRAGGRASGSAMQRELRLQTLGGGNIIRGVGEATRMGGLIASKGAVDDKKEFLGL